MINEKVNLTSGVADGYIVPLGTVNLVFAKTGSGMIACGAFDVMALDKFNYPAAKMKSNHGGPIATVEDLLNGVVREANASAGKRGVKEGMTGKEALELM